MRNNYLSRIKRFERDFARSNVDALIIANSADIRYLCGFEGLFGVLLWTQHYHLLITDFTHHEIAQKTARHVDVKCAMNSIMDEVGMLLLRMHIRRAGYDPVDLKVSELQQIQRHCSRSNYIVFPSIISQYRMRKDRNEIELIRKAVAITDAAYERFLAQIKPGITEVYAAGLLEFEFRNSGGDYPAFETIVLSGKRTSLPHGRASSKKISATDLILMDFGIRLSGYHTDTTRMFAFKDSCRRIKWRDVILKAFEEILAHIKPGIKLGRVVRASRAVLEKAGFGKHSNHALGHGIGLELHEEPIFTEGSEIILEEGMVFSVEPGIYIPGVGGYRREELVVVCKSGYEFLSLRPLHE